MSKYSISPVYFIYACSFLVTNVSIVIWVRCTKLYLYLHHGFLHKIVLVTIPANSHFEAKLLCFMYSHKNKFREVAVSDKYNLAIF